VAIAAALLPPCLHLSIPVERLRATAMKKTAPRVRLVDRPPFRFTLRPADHVADLAAQWRGLEDRAAPSFFQSWGWIGTWLAALKRHGKSEVFLLEVERDGRLVAVGILVPGEQFRHGFVRSRTFALNEAGNADYDMIVIEHNGLLVDPVEWDALQPMLVPALAGLDGRWTELFFGGVTEAYEAACALGGLPYRVRAAQEAYVRDLAAISFGRSTRYKIGRTRRDYARLGKIATEMAETREIADRFFSELKQLHQAYWQRRGKAGAFDTPFFEDFHRALIADRFPNEEIQLLRTCAGAKTVGYLYNFAYRGRIYNYQSGFDYDLLPKGRPGLLCHIEAIEWNRARGAACYDFLAGENQLKRSLSNRRERLLWLVVRRGSLPLRLEEGLRRLKTLFSRTNTDPLPAPND
jgi:CelD/BcsL family acetyltransferase involved in cellulose biosynthesis